MLFFSNQRHICNTSISKITQHWEDYKPVKEFILISKISFSLLQESAPLVNLHGIESFNLKWYTSSHTLLHMNMHTYILKTFLWWCWKQMFNRKLFCHYLNIPRNCNIWTLCCMSALNSLTLCSDTIGKVPFYFNSWLANSLKYTVCDILYSV